MKTEPVVVTAFGALSALGGTTTGFQALLEGAHGFTTPDWTGGLVAAPVASPDAREHRTLALARAVLSELKVEGDGLALLVATTTGSMDVGEQAMAAHARGEAPSRPADVFWTPLPHQPASALAHELGASGPHMTVSTACTSGTVAIGVAADLIRAGRCRRALVLGAEGLCHTTVFGFRSLGAYTPGRCRPFDQARDGMAIGEAAAYLLLEPASAARSKVELLGVGASTDGKSLTAPDPEGAGLVRAITEALGPVPPEAVDHVNAHATGTQHNDAAEAAALSRATPQAAVSATKGATGHTLGAAGVLEAVFLLQSMLGSVVPPVVGLEDPLPGVDVSPVARRREQRVGVSVNLAFGGHNAAVAFRLEAP